MSLGLQEKLLRLVEYGEFERLGGQRTLQVDVRVVAATNQDLRALARERRFRDDLLDRLSFDVVHLPALRQRPEDIPTLAEHFALQMAAELGWNLFPGFGEDARRALAEHHWPGNVRELKNAVERSLCRWEQPEQPVNAVAIDPFLSPYDDGQAAAEPPPAEDVADPTRGDATTDAREPEPVDFYRRIEGIERSLLQEALARHHHHQGRTAESLGLSYNQLRGLVRKHGLASRRRRG
jgi:psp operon transcriptional activator